MWGKVDDLTNNVRTLRRQAFMAEKDYALDPRNEKKKMPQEENKDKKDEKTCDENVAKARQEGRKQALEEMEGMIQNEEKK